MLFVVQSLSHIQLLATPWTAACQASLSITNSRSLLKLMSIELVMHPTISTSVIPFSSRLQSTHLKGLFNESVLCKRWPKYWSFSFSLSPSNEYSGLNCFRMDWLDLLVVQGTLESSLIPRIKSIYSVLSFFYSPTLTSIHDYWENHSLD